MLSGPEGSNQDAERALHRPTRAFDEDMDVDCDCSRRRFPAPRRCRGGNASGRRHRGAGTRTRDTGEDQLVNSKSGVHVKTKGSADLVSQQIVIAGGGHTGWHSHPGPVLVTVKPGGAAADLRQRRDLHGNCLRSGRQLHRSRRRGRPYRTERVSLERGRALGDVLRAGRSGRSVQARRACRSSC